MSIPFYALDKPGEKGVVLGNEGLARGIFEAGVKVASGYPGTPLFRNYGDSCTYS